MKALRILRKSGPATFSSPEPTILLACDKNRELWEQPFQACTIDADNVRPDGQNSVISFVISKWLLPELSIPTAGQKDRRLWRREWSGQSSRSLPQARRIVGSGDENGSQIRALDSFRRPEGS